jgi:hypothetical protein
MQNANARFMAGDLLGSALGIVWPRPRRQVGWVEAQPGREAEAILGRASAPAEDVHAHAAVSRDRDHR